MNLKFTKIVADENVPKEVVDMLEKLGFKEVYWISRHKPGIKDPEVWRLAASREAYLLSGDIRYFKQLGEGEILNGPDMLEYSTQGFTKSELQDPKVIQPLLEWFFQNGHHRLGEITSLKIEGVTRTRRSVWHQEKVKRKSL